MASNTRNDSFITFFPISNVNIIKVSATPVTQDSGLLTATFEQEMEAMIYAASVDEPTFRGDDIMQTNYLDDTTDAQYFTTGSAEALIIYSIYRKQPNDSYYNYVCTLRDGYYSLKDYNIKNNHYYHYMMTVEQQKVNTKTGEKVISYDVYESADEDGRNNYMCPRFNNWTICNIDLVDSDLGIYAKTGKAWYLGLNMQGESVTKKVNINTQDTLSRYPKITIGKTNYDSMSFSTLLGRIHQYDNYDYCGESNIDRQARLNIGYPVKADRYTEKMDERNSSTGEMGIYDKYATESDKLEAWKDFITDGQLKLIKDVKGNSWIVQIADSSEYNIEMASNLLQTTVTFQWNEVMSTDDISIVTEGT